MIKNLIGLAKLRLKKSLFDSSTKHYRLLNLIY